MANKQIDELVEKSDMLADDDLILVYDSAEAGSEKTKKVPISNYVGIINSDLTLYVASDGSDTTGDGTVGNPWATPHKAKMWLNNKVIGSNVTIQLADGTYNGLGTFFWTHSSSKVTIKGNETAPANVTLNFVDGGHGVMLPQQGYLYLAGLKIVGFSNSGSYSGIYTRHNGAIHLYKCVVDNWKTGVNIVFGGHCLFNASTLNNNGTGLSCQSARAELISSCTVSNNVTYGLSSIWAGEIFSLSSSFNSNGTDQNTTTNGRITIA
jgi:hypothetical protein